MPDPTAHADDMKSPAVIEPNATPAFWWINPWSYAISMKRALHAVHLLSEATEEAYQSAKTVIKQKQELADYHAKERNAFLREVEVTLKPACPHLYEDTIGYVHWAADEIKSLRVLSSGMKEDRDAYVGRVQALREEQQGLLHEARVAIAENETLKPDLEAARVEAAHLRAELDSALKRGNELQEKCRLIHGVHKGDVWIAGNHEPRIHAGEAPDLDAFRFGHMHVHEKPKAKRKPKRAVLAEDKTTGKKLLAPKKKAKYGDGRDDYSAIGRRYLKHLALVQARRKAIAKAKKKGGRK